MAPSPLLAQSSIRDYFLENVTAVLRRQSFQPHPCTISYVVDLLCDFARGRAIALEKALAVVLADSLLSLPSQSMQQLRHVGDQSLYLTGFFRDSLVKTQIDPEYYIVLGTTAYGRLHRVLRRLSRGTDLVIVYAELGQDFSRFVEVLGEVREQTSPSATESTSGGQLHQEGLVLVKRPPGRQ